MQMCVTCASSCLLDSGLPPQLARTSAASSAVKPRYPVSDPLLIQIAPEVSFGDGRPTRRPVQKPSRVTASARSASSTTPSRNAFRYGSSVAPLIARL